MNIMKLFVFCKLFRYLQQLSIFKDEIIGDNLHKLGGWTVVYKGMIQQLHSVRIFCNFQANLHKSIMKLLKRHLIDNNDHKKYKY